MQPVGSVFKIRDANGLLVKLLCTLYIVSKILIRYFIINVKREQLEIVTEFMVFNKVKPA